MTGLFGVLQRTDDLEDGKVTETRDMVVTFDTFGGALASIGGLLSGIERDEDGLKNVDIVFNRGRRFGEPFLTFVTDTNNSKRITHKIYNCISYMEMPNWPGE